MIHLYKAFDVLYFAFFLSKVFLILLKDIKTSSKSIAIKDNINIVDLEGYKSGRWWVQDYAATIPVKLIGNVYKKKVLDMCSAPGGKTFQLINMGADVTSNDYSKKRLGTMKENAKNI